MHRCSTLFNQSGPLSFAKATTLQWSPFIVIVIIILTIIVIIVEYQHYFNHHHHGYCYTNCVCHKHSNGNLLLFSTQIFPVHSHGNLLLLSAQIFLAWITFPVIGNPVIGSQIPKTIPFLFQFSTSSLTPSCTENICSSLKRIFNVTESGTARGVERRWMKYVLFL